MVLKHPTEKGRIVLAFKRLTNFQAPWCTICVSKHETITKSRECSKTAISAHQSHMDQISFLLIQIISYSRNESESAQKHHAANTQRIANRTFEAVSMLMQAQGNLLMWCWKFYLNSLGKEIQMHHSRLSNSQLQHSDIKSCRSLLHQTPATIMSYLRLMKFSGGMIISFCHLIGWQKQMSLNIVHRQGLRSPSVKVISIWWVTGPWFRIWFPNLLSSGAHSFLAIYEFPLEVILEDCHHERIYAFKQTLCCSLLHLLLISQGRK